MTISAWTPAGHDAGGACGADVTALQISSLQGAVSRSSSRPQAVERGCTLTETVLTEVLHAQGESGDSAAAPGTHATSDVAITRSPRTGSAPGGRCGSR